MQEEEGRDKKSPSKAARALCPDPARRHDAEQASLDLPNAYTNTEIDSVLKRAPGEALLHADGKMRCLTHGELLSAGHRCLFLA